MSEALNESTAPCAYCGQLVTSTDYCHGCRQHVCEACDWLMPWGKPHPAAAHQERVPGPAFMADEYCGPGEVRPELLQRILGRDTPQRASVAISATGSAATLRRAIELLSLRSDGAAKHLVTLCTARLAVLNAAPGVTTPAGGAQ
jgi:hypothetical protein